ncbi:MAG: hypothetical protein ABW209_14060 [Pseudomonas caspiana]
MQWLAFTLRNAKKFANITDIKSNNFKLAFSGDSKRQIAMLAVSRDGKKKSSYSVTCGVDPEAATDSRIAAKSIDRGRLPDSYGSFKKLSFKKSCNFKAGIFKQ